MDKMLSLSRVHLTLTHLLGSSEISMDKLQDKQDDKRGERLGRAEVKVGGARWEVRGGRWKVVSARCEVGGRSVLIPGVCRDILSLSRARLTHPLTSYPAPR